jgi:DNA polymerase IV (DinB-like DNA polymerase)
LVGDNRAVVLHVDFDYFFAQCEEIRKPEIKGRPVVVCVFSGRTEDSGVVSTANYVARKYGVKSGMPIKVAKSKLAGTPDALLLPLDAPYYRQVSEKAMAMIKKHADVFEHVGIDECYLDVSTAGDPEMVARQIKAEIKSQLQLTCSVGIAPNKMLAKIASDMRKPDGLTIIKEQDAAGFVASLDVDKIPGIGPKTKERLAEMGVTTAGQLAAVDLFRLIDEFGKKTGTYIHNAARGIDGEPVTESEGDRKQQIMRIVTLKKDATQSEEMHGDLEEICKTVHKSAEEKKLAFRTVGVLLILNNLENVTRSRTLKTHTSSYELLHSTARSILDEAMMADEKKKMTVRRLGVRLADFQDSAGQGTLFEFMR